jgi:hypothetical protein
MAPDDWSGGVPVAQACIEADALAQAELIVVIFSAVQRPFFTTMLKVCMMGSRVGPLLGFASM